MYKYKSLQEGQLPQEHLSFLKNLLNFIITKYLVQEVDDDLWPLYDWIYKDLSMSHDQKIMT